MSNIATIVLVFCGSISAIQLRAQQEKDHHTGLHLELGGSGGLFSVNIERVLSQTTVLRIGYANWSVEGGWVESIESFNMFPIIFTHLVGSRKSKLEIGGGILLGRREFQSDIGDNYSVPISNITGLIGYRYQPPTEGLLFRIGLMPFYHIGNTEHAYPDSDFMLAVGVSVGYSF